MTPEQASRRREYSQLMTALIERYQKSVKRGELANHFFKSIELPPRMILHLKILVEREKEGKTRDSADEVEALKKLAHENRSMLQELLRRGQNSHC